MGPSRACLFVGYVERSLFQMHTSTVSRWGCLLHLVQNLLIPSPLPLFHHAIKLIWTPIYPSPLSQPFPQTLPHYHPLVTINTATFPWFPALKCQQPQLPATLCISASLTLRLFKLISFAMPKTGTGFLVQFVGGCGVWWWFSSSAEMGPGGPGQLPSGPRTSSPNTTESMVVSFALNY